MGSMRIYGDGVVRQELKTRLWRTKGGNGEDDKSEKMPRRKTDSLIDDTWHKHVRDQQRTGWKGSEKKGAKGGQCTIRSFLCHWGLDPPEVGAGREMIACGVAC